MERILVVAGLVEGEPPGRFLLARRPPGKHLADWWEFPGGKLDPGEAPEAGLRRELQEELGVEVEIGDVFAVGHHVYPEREVILLVYRCRITRGTPACLQVAEIRWLSTAELLELPLPPADEPVVARLRRELSA